MLDPQDGQCLQQAPQNVQAKAKAMLHDIWMAETQAAAEKAFDLFGTTFTVKFQV